MAEVNPLFSLGILAHVYCGSDSDAYDLFWMEVSMGWLVAGGFVFWVLVAICSILIIAGVANDVLLLPFVASLALLGILHYTGVLAKLAPFAPAHWWGWVLLVILYLTIGAGWSFFRFYTVFKDDVERYIENNQEWFYDQDEIKKLPKAEQDEAWKRTVRKNGPQVYHYSPRICTWLFYWPVSIVHYILIELLWDLWEGIWEWIRTVYDRIADYIRNKLLP